MMEMDNKSVAVGDDYTMESFPKYAAGKGAPEC